MKTKNKEIVFSNGDPMKPVFCVDGKKYYTDKDVERLIEEYDDRLRVARGNFNLVENLNSFVERDLKKARRALWLARAERYKMREFIAREEGNLCNQMSWSRVLRERTYNQWVDQLLRIANLANKLQNKCLKKAEEYK